MSVACDKDCLHFQYYFMVSLHTSRCSAREPHELWYQYPFSLGFSRLCRCSGDVGGHAVVVRLVAASREPVSEGGQLAFHLIPASGDDEVYRRIESILMLGGGGEI